MWNFSSLFTGNIDGLSYSDCDSLKIDTCGIISFFWYYLTVITSEYVEESPTYYVGSVGVISGFSTDGAAASLSSLSIWNTCWLDVSL